MGARLKNKFMLLSEDEFKSTFSSEGFLNVTETAEYDIREKYGL